MNDFQHDVVEANGIAIHVASAGKGPPLLFLHGFPHTWFVWRNVMRALASEHHVIAPDLRGLGDTTRAASGYDLDTLVADALAVLDAHTKEPAVIIGLDLGAPIAFLTASRHPARVKKLVVMEALLGGLPGAETFRPPWWFAFHAIPGMPEEVISGREEAYLDHFFAIGTKRGLPAEARAAFLKAYRGRDSLRCAFAHYRALPENAQLLAKVERLTVPTLAISGGVVGDALARQVAPLCDHLETARLTDAAHILPEDQPAALAALLRGFARTQG
ncbi:alpha/beta fold hydrolase [Corallococcus sp. AB030]|uniref:alpha/beta fold hydrolase n=1 Tax=Corallococcus TaxID=83461 RepID=UPI000EDEC931|nr:MULTISPECIES: alpha/beta fold hydrolase [unclassified Corallococcus]RKI02391.1 alpha/beta fold hydrolase [Corallococcus sp. AB030]RUO93211.1 alpha/beta fold hydrolase [Corallococcus sp. AB018]